VSENADNKLMINDPNFWNIVLKNVQSPTQQLLKKLKAKEYQTTIEVQKQIMLEASEQLNVIIENKLSRNGLNADDEINLADILTIISAERSFHKFYRDLASSWLEEIYKPSRRFKKLTPDDLVIQARTVTKKAVNLRSNNEEADIFADED
jgi:chromodomain-helicase-DNA-binding protein 7